GHARAHAGDVGAGVRLAAAVRAERQPLGEPRQELLLLLVAAGDQQRRRAEGIRRHRRVDAGASERHLLLHEAVVEATAAEPAVRLGDLDVHEPGLPGLLQDLARELAGIIVVRGARHDLLAGEVARGLDEGILFFAEAEVHDPGTVPGLGY